MYNVHPVFRRMDEHRVLTVIVRNVGDEAHLYRHAHAQASPVVGPVAVAAAGSCGGGDRGFPPSAVGGWRGVDQYVKIESDATHPAIPPPPAAFPLCPLGSSPPYASSTTLQPPLPGPAEGIAAQSTDLSPTHHFLRRRVDFSKLTVESVQTLWPFH